MDAQNQENLAVCSLCPALCRLSLMRTGPDQWRVEYPAEAGAGLCPRGSMLGELTASPRRLRWCGRAGSSAAPSWEQALSAVAAGMAGGAVVLLDGNLPLEELAAAAHVARHWPAVKLALAVAPEDEQALLGVEASGAPYLADEELARCDGFLVVGDAYAANPRLARGVMDALKERPRSPVVVIDSGGGTTAGFATLRLAVRPGGEAEALGGEAVAGALGACQKLGVLISAEPGRGGIWRRVGYLAGKIANEHKGGVAVATVGANALAAVRMRHELGLLSLAQALSGVAGGTAFQAVQAQVGKPVPPDAQVGKPVPLVALGCDVLGLLGWTGPRLLAAASALPNETTAAAEWVLPLALTGEIGGTYLQAGTRQVKAAAMIAPPAAVTTPAQLLARLAMTAGINVPAFDGKLPSLNRLTPGEPPAVVAQPFQAVQAQPVRAVPRSLTAGRQALHSGAGSLTGLASWQRQLRPLPELRLNPADADELGLATGDAVELETPAGSAYAVVRLSASLARGCLAIAEGYSAARRLLAYTVAGDELVSAPAAVVSVSKASALVGEGT